MLDYRTGVFGESVVVGTQRVPLGIHEGARIKGSRWMFVAGPDETGYDEWIWKLIRYHPTYAPVWYFDGPAIDINQSWSTRMRFWTCLKDAQQHATRISTALHQDLVNRDHDAMGAVMEAAQGAAMWDEIEEWLDSVELFTRHCVQA